MKKISSLFVGLSLAVVAIAGTQAAHPVKVHQSFHMPAIANASRAVACDTLQNLDFNTADSTAYIYPLDSPNVGYADGNGALYAGPAGHLAISHVGEKFYTTSTGSYATFAIAFFDAPTLNATHADSVLAVTAYVFDTTGTGYYGGPAPGNAVDSASVTTGSIIANRGGAFFNFTHQAVLPGKSFFVMVKLPQVAGDTLILLTTDGTTGTGNAWLGAGGAFIPVDSIFFGKPGNYVIAGVCKTILGIEDAAGVTELSVYPNPSYGNVNVSFSMETASDVAISVLDITGKKIYENTEKGIANYNKAINLSTAAPGVYIVNIKTATGTINRRISIQ